MSSVPASRSHRLNERPKRAERRFVLYWMSSARRPRWNFALDRAIEYAARLRKPLLVVETLAADTPWMNRRHGALVLDGMASNAKGFGRKRISYVPCIASDARRLKRTLKTLIADAAIVVTDRFPLREHVDLQDAVVRGVNVRVEAVDSSGLLPLSATDRAFPTAHGFRRHLQKTLPDHLTDWPVADPKLPAQFPRLAEAAVEASPKCLVGSEAVVDSGRAMLARWAAGHDAEPVDLTGGHQAADRTLRRFLADRLAVYGEDRNHPQRAATSGLSPYLHHGHISVHQVLAELIERMGWSPDRLADRPTGSREGWWGMDPTAECFLDELVTWREVGLNMCVHRGDYDVAESLPDWAQATLNQHNGDRREHEYSLEDFRSAATHDELWNAAQRQLQRDGVIHNYLRMLWGKKILEWTPDWQTALDVMLDLNNTYAIDGCDPNSYSGIFWVLGRYDRAWGPERPIFGKVRYMSSANTARKMAVGEYIKRYASA